MIDGPLTPSWWGYICSNFYSTFSSTEFTYGGAGADPELNAARLEIGWGF